MDDKFLYDRRPPLRKEFTEGLYQRLSSQSPDPRLARKDGKTMPLSVFRFTVWRFALFVFLIAAIIWTFSGTASATALEWIRKIAGFNVEERSTPIEVYSPAATVYAVPTAVLPDVLANPPFPFSLPAWVPDGYTLNPTVGVANSKSWVIMYWANPQGKEIALLVNSDFDGLTIPVGENSSEEVEVNGQPALLVRGYWDSRGVWDFKRDVTIEWIKNNIRYHLSYSERDVQKYETQLIAGDEDAVIAELIRMAESIP